MTIADWLSVVSSFQSNNARRLLEQATWLFVAHLVPVITIIVHASFTTDLRFLDALNYYYELLPSNWHPMSKHNWLLASYWSFFARALTVHVNRIN